MQAENGWPLYYRRTLERQQQGVKSADLVESLILEAPYKNKRKSNILYHFSQLIVFGKQDNNRCARKIN